MLGGSFGLALRARGLAGQVTGYVRRESSIQECLAAGAVDEATTELGRAVTGADLVVFCTPLARMEALAREMTGALGKGVLGTDVGSVKTPVVEALGPVFAAAGGEFVGSHPMAGSEKMGVAAARADLFEEAICVVTPAPGNSAHGIARVEELWRGIGSRVMKLAPGDHDRLVSRSSHLPHVIAAGLAKYVLDPEEVPEQQKLCANGFRDTTRVASGSPEMWRDIALANRGPLKEALVAYLAGLREFERLLDQGDGAAIEGFFREAKGRRDAWGVQCSPVSPE